MRRVAGRGRRRGEQGVTLIELLVTIAVMSIGFVAVISAFSTIEIAVGSIGQDAQLTSQARQVGDFIQSEQYSYITCGTAAGYNATLQTAINANTVVLQTGYTARVILVVQATGGSHVVSGTSGALIPIGGCTGSTHDFGVQQIQFQLTTSRNSITRTVYKRWN